MLQLDHLAEHCRHLGGPRRERLREREQRRLRGPRARAGHSHRRGGLARVADDGRQRRDVRSGREGKECGLRGARTGGVRARRCGGRGGGRGRLRARRGGGRLHGGQHVLAGLLSEALLRLQLPPALLLLVLTTALLLLALAAPLLLLALVATLLLLLPAAPLLLFLLAAALGLALEARTLLGLAATAFGLLEALPALQLLEPRPRCRRLLLAPPLLLLAFTLPLRLGSCLCHESLLARLLLLLCLTLLLRAFHGLPQTKTLLALQFGLQEGGLLELSLLVRRLFQQLQPPPGEPSGQPRRGRHQRHCRLRALFLTRT